MFKLHDTTEHGAMNCRNDYSTYFTKATGKKVLAAFALLVTVESGFGYAMAEILAGVHLEHFYRPGKDPVLAQFMHGVPLCCEATFTIVSDRKKSTTVPPTIRNPCATLKSSTWALLYSAMMALAIPLQSFSWHVSVSRRMSSALCHAHEVQNFQSAIKEGPTCGQNKSTGEA